MSTVSNTSLKDQGTTQHESLVNSTEDHTNSNHDEDKRPHCKETSVQIESTHENLETGRAIAMYPVKTRSTWVYMMMNDHRAGYGDPMYGSDTLDYTPDRNRFVALVFTIVFVMVTATAVSTAVIINVHETKMFMMEYSKMLSIAAAGMLLGISYAMSCSPCSRMFPCNIVFLMLAVVGMTILCVMLCMRYPADLILMAMGSSAGVDLICLLLAFSSFDFTSWLLYIVVISAAVGIGSLAVGLYMMITGVYISWLHLAILFAGLILNVVMLTVELQMVLGGRTVEIGKDDYAFAAYLLYVSIIDIFLKILQLLGGFMGGFD